MKYETIHFFFTSMWEFVWYEYHAGWKGARTDQQLFGVCLVWYCLWYCNSIYSYMYLQLHVTYISFRCLAFYLFFVVGVSFVCRQSGMPPFPPGILSQSACVWYEYVFFSDRQQYVLRYFSRPHTPLARAIDVPHHANMSFDEVFDLPGEVSF